MLAGSRDKTPDRKTDSGSCGGCRDRYKKNIYTQYFVQKCMMAAEIEKQKNKQKINE